jgi:hypothetical protein
MAFVKKIKFDAKNWAFHMTILSFLHIPQKVSVFDKTLQTHLDCIYVNTKYLIKFFNILKYTHQGAELNFQV